MEIKKRNIILTKEAESAVKGRCNATAVDISATSSESVQAKSNKKVMIQVKIRGNK